MNDNAIIVLNGAKNLQALATAENLVSNLTSDRAYSNPNSGRGSDDPRRDFNWECGYPETENLTVESHFQPMVERNPIAARVVEVLPLETWQTQPGIFEDIDSESKTHFETAWDQVGDGLRQKSYYKDEEGNPIWEYLLRADILSGIGRYGVLLLGIDDGKPLSEPVEGFPDDSEGYGGFDDNGRPNRTDVSYNQLGYLVSNAELAEEKKRLAKQKLAPEVETDEDGKVKTARRLIYLRAYSENLAKIARVDGDPRSPRYNQPTMYNITLTDPRNMVAIDGTTNHTVQVHWSRVIHLCDGYGSSEVCSESRLQVPYNRLLDIEKMFGSGAEMFYKNGFPGLSIESHPSVGPDVAWDRTAMKRQLNDYMNTLQRVLIMQGGTVKTLSATVADPSTQIDTQITAICIKIGVPKRVFMGSERGELASGQDDSTWNDRLAARQKLYVIPRIVIPFVDRLIAMKVLPEPTEYHIDWESDQMVKPTEQADILVKRVQAMSAYVSGGVDTLLPPQDFLTREMDYTEEEAEEILAAAVEHIEAANPDAEQEVVPGRNPPAPMPEGGAIDPKTGKPVGPPGATPKATAGAKGAVPPKPGAKAPTGSPASKNGAKKPTKGAK